MSTTVSSTDPNVHLFYGLIAGGVFTPDEATLFTEDARLAAAENRVLIDLPIALAAAKAAENLKTVRGDASIKGKAEPHLRREILQEKGAEKPPPAKGEPRPPAKRKYRAPGSIRLRSSPAYGAICSRVAQWLPDVKTRDQHTVRTYFRTAMWFLYCNRPETDRRSAADFVAGVTAEQISKIVYDDSNVKRPRRQSITDLIAAIVRADNRAVQAKAEAEAAKVKAEIVAATRIKEPTPAPPG